MRKKVDDRVGPAKRSRRRVVITYGTYDMLHVGHINLLRRARNLGDYLIVGLSTDAFNTIKHKSAYQPYAHRRRLLEALRFVDKVVPERCWEQKTRDIKKFKASVLVMGDDWKGEFDSLKKLCRVVYLKRTPSISSTQLRALT